MGLLSVGEFAHLSRLSPKALRIYDELGLLPPTRVDPDSGYRWYATDQLERARLVASLRRVGVPLAQIQVVVGMQPDAAADRLAGYWADAETVHAARRELVDYLVHRLRGEEPVMYEVATRQMPARRVLCLHRHVDPAGAWALGKEFVGLFGDRPVPRTEGRQGAAFVIYHGEVSDDSDGPIEWCMPVPDDQAHDLAALFPELILRTEPAHDEAFIHLGDTQASPLRWQLVSETLYAWAAEHHRSPVDLAPRVTFLTTPPVTAASVADCDFAVPVG